ncbi:MAG: alpha-galactosidase [Pirellulaceae bacterium]
MISRSSSSQSRSLLAVTAIVLCLLNAIRLFGADDGAPGEREKRLACTWAAAHLAAATPDDALIAPFSFTFQGESSTAWLARSTHARSARQLDNQRTQHTRTWTDPTTGLEVQCLGIEYHDYPVVEWTVHFRNRGTADTPILENIQALDTTWQREQEDEFLLHHGIGSPANGSDYGPLETLLEPAVVKRIGAAGGRPTNSDLSYFNLQWGAQGAILAVGWPGQWAAEFARDDDRGVHVRVGQELTHFKLLPGEHVRTPLIALLFWEGDWIRAQNLWRRWMMAHNMPRPGGQLPPPQFVASSSRAYEEMIGANEANQIMHIDRYLEEQLKLDYWWMDAGWYIQQQGWPQVGTWEIDPQRFPRGFRPISDHAHARGVKTLVWFEPERVAPGTWLYETHPDWLLRTELNHPLAGMHGWSASELGGSDPCVTHNPTDQVREMATMRWDPGQLSFHPGPNGEYCTVRWTAAHAGTFTVHAAFSAIDQQTTTDVHLLHNGTALFDELLQLEGRGRRAEYQGTLAISAGDTVDCIVGWGNGAHICDSTGLEFRLTDRHGKTYDAAKDFYVVATATGPWTYGHLQPGATPDVSTFRAFDRLSRPGEEGQRLLNLGDVDARQWLTDHIDRLLTEQGIDLYRQDFNIDPLPFWRANDAPDRQGITENHHVTGYLAYWDELRRRHPDMLIDTCASGGRRNDLETLRRAVPLWRSDYAYEPVGHQCMTYGISLWIPYHGTGTVACSQAGYYGGGPTPVEPYAFWSNAAPSLGSGIDIRVREIDYDALRQLVSQWRNVNRYYYADYYPLTPYSRANTEWIAWQFHDPATHSGVIQAFRRDQCEATSIQLKLRGLDPAATYEFTQLDTSGSMQHAGQELRDAGLTVQSAARPAAVIIIYRQIQPAK